MIEGIILAFLLGILSGLIPGLHINNTCLILKNIDKDLIPLSLGIYLPLTIIPLVFLSSGNGNEATGLFILRRLIKEGKINKSFSTAVFSSLLSSIFSLLFYMLIPGAIKTAYYLLKPNVYYLVLFISIFIIVNSKNRTTFFIIFLISGIIGMESFYYLKGDKFLPMFTGFFALSALSRIKRLKDIRFRRVKINKLILPSMIGSLLGFFSVLLPGISSPSIMIGLIAGSSSLEPISYLSTSYAFMTSQSFYSIISYEEVGKARTGAIEISKGGDYFLLFSGIIIGGMLTMLLINPTKYLVNKINPLWIVLFLIGMVFLNSGLYGILIGLLSYILAEIRIKEDVSGTSHLGSIIIPVLINAFF